MIKDLDIDKNKTELFKKGYSIIENRISNETLKSAHQLTLRGDYDNIRVYDDYSNIKNIAGIEAPFHKKILRQEILDLIEESKIIDIAQNIIQDDVILELSRYHLTKNFSHVGIWHRDADVAQHKYEALQLNIFLFEERGLQVIDGSHQVKDKKADLLLKKNPYTSLQNSKWLKTAAGNILVFDPSLLHRGISANPRANMHFRFRRKHGKNYTIQSYDYLENYKMSEKLKQQVLCNLADLNTLAPYTHPKSIKYTFIRILRRLVHNLVIFLPLNSKVYSYFIAWPNLSLRKFFRIKI